MTVIAQAGPTAATLRRPRWTLRLLRLLLTGHVALAAMQPVLAGRFLVGDVDAIGVHAGVAFAVAALGLLSAAAAVLYWLAGRGRFWVVPATAAVLFAELAQIGTGYSRALQVHVPLGVAVVAGAVALAGWSWSAGARQPRSSR